MNKTTYLIMAIAFAMIAYINSVNTPTEQAIPTINTNFSTLESEFAAYHPFDTNNEQKRLLEPDYNSYK